MKIQLTFAFCRQHYRIEGVLETPTNFDISGVQLGVVMNDRSSIEFY